MTNHDKQEPVDIHEVSLVVGSRLHLEAREAFSKLNPWVILRPTVLLYVATKSDDERVYCALGDPHSNTSISNVVVELPSTYTREALIADHSKRIRPGTMITLDADQTCYIVDNDIIPGK